MKPTTSSQQVAWWEVHKFVTAHIKAQHWPMVGTPAWCALPDDHPAKLAAIFDAAQHWALRLETCQQALAAAAHDIAGAADWPTIAREIRSRADFYATHPGLKRVTP